MFYAFLGWLIEVIAIGWKKKKFVNRGFLIGPYCPIYGWGALSIILLVGRNTNDVLSVFLKSFFVCSLLEYFTSYLMEKIFKIRWWDYSHRRFNINGRICLETMIPFSLLALFIIYFLQPIIVNLVGYLSKTTVIIVAIIIFIIFLVDIIISLYILLKIKGKIKDNKRKDSTEKIRKYVTDWLQNNSIFYRRIKEAFPRFKIFNKLKKEK